MKNSPSFELFDIDSRNITMFGRVVRIEQNGFLLCKQGSVILVLDDKQYVLRKGDLYLYPAFSETCIQSFSHDFQGVAGASDFNFVLPALNSISDTQSYVFIRFHPYVSLTDEQFDRIEKMIAFIRQRQSVQTALGMQCVSVLVQAICYEFIDAYVANYPIRPTKQDRKDKNFQNFIIALHRDCRIHRDVMFYAEQQCLTPRYFATLVHEKSGKSPSQWITIFVIAEAKRMLVNPDISIKEIANSLNFPNQSFFGRYFKQHAGVSPSQYRQSSQISNG